MFRLFKNKSCRSGDAPASDTASVEEQAEVDGQRLTLPLELEDGRVPSLMKNGTYVIGGLLTLALLWGMFAQIRELAVAHGAIVPSGTVKLVHHLEGGIIDSVKVEEGQLVQKGAILATLRSASAISELEQLKLRDVAIRFRVERLTALLESRQPDFRAAGKAHSMIAREQFELFKTQLALEKSESESIGLRIEQRRVELGSLRLELASIKRQVTLKAEQVTAYEALIEKRFTTRRTLIDARADYEQTLSRRVALDGRTRVAIKTLAEAQNQLVEWSAKNRNSFAQERAKLHAELNELRQSIVSRDDRVKRLTAVSPVKGIVQLIGFHTSGEVVKPGDLIAKIVPLDEEIVAEVRVTPGDIGHVHEGDAAELKISTFDPNVFGVVKGTVRTLSASTFEDPKGGTYYKAIIALEKNHVGPESIRRPILPGMVVQADIITGAKSMVKYLLKPVYRSLNTAFTER